LPQSVANREPDHLGERFEHAMAFFGGCARGIAKVTKFGASLREGPRACRKPCGEIDPDRREVANTFRVDAVWARGHHN
jgi:hypothetical protein